MSEVSHQETGDFTIMNNWMPIQDQNIIHHAIYGLSNLDNACFSIHDDCNLL